MDTEEISKKSVFKSLIFSCLEHKLYLLRNYEEILVYNKQIKL